MNTISFIPITAGCLFSCALGVASCATSDATGDAPDAGSDDAAIAVHTGDAATHDAAVDAPSRDAAARSDASDASAPGDAAPEAQAPDPTTLDLHQVTLFDNPANVADWPETTKITAVEFQYMGADGVRVEFSKRDGAGSWPDVTPPGWTGPLEYTLGFVEKINGRWYGSAAIQFWRGLDAFGGNVAKDIVTAGPCATFGLGSSCQVAKNWYYDGRWGNLAGYQPATGEIVGVFVVAGNLRGVTDGSQSPVKERSNVVLLRMPGWSGGRYTF